MTEFEKFLDECEGYGLTYTHLYNQRDKLRAMVRFMTGKNSGLHPETAKQLNKIAKGE